LYDKLYQTKVEKGFEPIFQLVIRYGRTIERFYEYEVPDLYALAGFPRGVNGLRLFARVGSEAATGTFDLAGRSWFYPEPELHRTELDRLAAFFAG